MYVLSMAKKKHMGRWLRASHSPQLIEPRSPVHLSGSSYQTELHFFDEELFNKIFLIGFL